MEATQTRDQDKDLKIDSNEINVSNRKNSSLYVYVCKRILENHDTVILNALGNATTIAVITAENLVRNGYAEYQRLETKTINVEQQKRDQKEGEGEQEDNRSRQKAKLLITLAKSKNFDENLAKFNAIREENQKFIENEKTEKAEKADKTTKTESKWLRK